MILVIDNYDSFTYNIVQYLLQLGEEVQVFRNDAITPDEAEGLDFSHLVISPGPGRPESAGNSVALIRRFAGRKPILGICLGHQSIAAAFGGKIVRARRIMHGKTDTIRHNGKTVFAELPQPLRVIRYHSLAVDPKSLPEGFEVTATSDDGEVMALRNSALRLEGVQFHPESVGSEEGLRLLRNFIRGVQEVPSVRELLIRVTEKKHLVRKEAHHLMDQITEGVVTPAQVGSFLTAMTMKGPTIEELAGFSELMLDKAVPIPFSAPIDCIDTCGTGGDSSGTFNISTAAALVAAGAGAKVAKHGNRSITSRSGSADVLEALGVPIRLSPADAARSIEEVGMAFLFAPDYHPAFKNIMSPRRELAFRTLFNMMGPMLNPARVKHQVMGVFAPELTETVARVLSELGVQDVYAVHGAGGMDEFSLTGTTRVTELRNGWMRTIEFDPRNHGFDLCAPSDLKGGDAVENGRIILRILEGEPGPRRDIVVLNAAAALHAGNLAETFDSGIALAKKAIDSGAARSVVDRLIAFGKGRGS